MPIRSELPITAYISRELIQIMSYNRSYFGCSLLGPADWASLFSTAPLADALIVEDVAAL
jgi:hypothetical protein